MSTNPTLTERLIGVAAMAGMLTGVLSLFAALFAFFNADWSATGLCLIAAALAFGLVLNATLRK